VDAFFFELFCGFDAFPGGGDFDEDAVALVAFGFVGADEFAGFVDGALGIEGEACVDFGGDAAGDDVEDFEAEEDEDAVEDGVGAGGAGEGRQAAAPSSRSTTARTVCEDSGEECLMLSNLTWSRNAGHLPHVLTTKTSVPPVPGATSGVDVRRGQYDRLSALWPVHTRCDRHCLRFQLSAPPDRRSSRRGPGVCADGRGTVA
jgi:hypothetical protein